MKKQSPILVEQTFGELRDRKDYKALGEFFWRGFMFEDEEQRKAYRLLWHRLSPKEQKLCDKK